MLNIELYATCVRSAHSRTAQSYWEKKKEQQLLDTKQVNWTRNWFGSERFAFTLVELFVCSSVRSARTKLIWLNERMYHVPAPEALLWRPMRHNALASQTQWVHVCVCVFCVHVCVCECVHMMSAWVVSPSGMCALCVCVVVRVCVAVSVFAWRYTVRCTCSSHTIVSLQSRNPGSRNQSLRKICRMRSTILIHTKFLATTTTTTTKHTYKSSGQK